MSTLIAPPPPANPFTRLPQLELPVVYTVHGLPAEERNVMAWNKAIAATSETRNHTAQLLREMRQEEARQKDFGIVAPDVSWNMTRDYLRCVLQVPPSLSSPASSVTSQDVLDRSVLGCSMASSCPSKRPPQVASPKFSIPEEVPRETMSFEEVNDWMKSSTRQYNEDMLSKTLSSTRGGSPLSCSTFTGNRFGLGSESNVTTEESP